MYNRDDLVKQLTRAFNFIEHKIIINMALIQPLNDGNFFYYQTLWFAKTVNIF